MQLPRVTSKCKSTAMFRYAAVVVALFVFQLEPNTTASVPIRVTIECNPRPLLDDTPFKRKAIDLRNMNFNINSFCDFIHGAIPKAIKDGKFVIYEKAQEYDDDQRGSSNDVIPFAVPPPNGFIPEFKFPKFKTIQVPKLSVPKIRKLHGAPAAPRLKSEPLLPLRKTIQENSSAERLEKFKKGVNKMLRVVKVLGQIDEYLSERTRIVVDKLAKTFE